MYIKIMAICKTRINGSPSRKTLVFVLCRKNLIPAIAPISPPRNEEKSNLFSGIRHWSWTALCLSTPNKMKVITFIQRRYSQKYLFVIGFMKSHFPPKSMRFNQNICQLFNLSYLQGSIPDNIHILPHHTV